MFPIEESMLISIQPKRSVHNGKTWRLVEVSFRPREAAARVLSHHAPAKRYVWSSLVYSPDPPGVSQGPMDAEK